jgi:hypothetical protein
MVKQVFCPILLILFLACGGVAQAQSTARPNLYFAKPPTRLADGSLVGGPAAFTVEEITTGFPEIAEMKGVLLTVYWATICPTEERCDYSIIDKALQYWGAKGKKVILAVATIGFPRKVLRDGAEVLVNATPEWVMRETGTYSLPGSITFGVIGSKSMQGTATVVYPQFWHPAFMTEIERLVRQLAVRYDGNPTIAQLRMGFGLMTEENPPVGWFGQTPVGYSEIGWIDTCARIAAIYQQNFHKSQLEFQITRMASGYVFLKDSAYRAAVDNLMNWLEQHKVFLAYDNLTNPPETQKQGLPAARRRLGRAAGRGASAVGVPICA